MAEQAVKLHGISIRLACECMHISETCYRYQPKLKTENTALYIPASMGDVISEIVVSLPSQVVAGTVEIVGREHVVTWFETVASDEPLSQIRQTIRPAEGSSFVNGSSVFDADNLIGGYAGSKDLIEERDESGRYAKEVRLFTFLNAFSFSSNFLGTAVDGVIQPLPVVLSGDQAPRHIPPARNQQDLGAAYFWRVDSVFVLGFDRVDLVFADAFD